MTSQRSRAFVRMWRIVVLLRCQPHTIVGLADKLGVCCRTIRRDLEALQAVPLPIESRSVRLGKPHAWSFTETPAWPSHEAAPIADVGTEAR